MLRPAPTWAIVGNSGSPPVLPEPVDEAAGSLGGPQRGHERGEFRGVERPRGADAGAQIDAERAHGPDGIGDVGGVQAAGQKDGNRGEFNDLAADGPVVGAPGAAQLASGRIARVEQEGIDVGAGSEGTLDRLFVADMDDLDDAKGGAGFSEPGVDLWAALVVDDLDCGHTGRPGVMDDRVGLGLRGEQERGDGWGCALGDGPNQIVGDGPRAGGHASDQAERVGSGRDGEAGLMS